jgi:hypothetical protein
MKATTRVRLTCTTLLFAAVIIMSNHALAGTSPPESSCAVLQLSAGLADNQVFAEVDDAQASLEDLVNIGQPAGKQGLENCNQQAPNPKEQLHGAASCTIQELAGKLKAKPSQEARDWDER